jgi:hypothetical protein
MKKKVYIRTRAGEKHLSTPDTNFGRFGSIGYSTLYPSARGVTCYDYGFFHVPPIKAELQSIVNSFGKYGRALLAYVDLFVVGVESTPEITFPEYLIKADLGELPKKYSNDLDDYLLGLKILREVETNDKCTVYVEHYPVKDKLKLMQMRNKVKVDQDIYEQAKKLSELMANPLKNI